MREPSISVWRAHMAAAIDAIPPMDCLLIIQLALRASRLGAWKDVAHVIFGMVNEYNENKITRLINTYMPTMYHYHYKPGSVMADAYGFKAGCDRMTYIIAPSKRRDFMNRIAHVHRHIIRRALASRVIRLLCTMDNPHEQWYGYRVCIEVQWKPFYVIVILQWEGHFDEKYEGCQVLYEKDGKYVYEPRP